MNDNARLAVAYHKTASGHFYSIVRLVEFEGELFALALPQGRYRWQEWQFSNRRAAFKAAREAEGKVHPFLVTQDYTQRHCYAVKQLGA